MITLRGKEWLNVVPLHYPLIPYKPEPHFNTYKTQHKSSHKYPII